MIFLRKFEYKFASSIRNEFYNRRNLFVAIKYLQHFGRQFRSFFKLKSFFWSKYIEIHVIFQ